jgi:hypothetical protein
MANDWSLPKMAEPAMDGLFAGVDQVGVDVVFGRKRSDAEHAVFALQPDFFVGGHEVGHQGWDTDAQVDVKTVFEFVCRTRGHLVLCPAHIKLPLSQ